MNIDTIHIGSYHSIEIENGKYDTGILKDSPDGKRISCSTFAYNQKLPFDLFRFDANTGKIYDYLKIDDVFQQYGVSFSPDNSKLYLSTDQRIILGRYIEYIKQIRFEFTINCENKKFRQEYYYR